MGFITIVVILSLIGFGLLIILSAAWFAFAALLVALAEKLEKK